MPTDFDSVLDDLARAIVPDERWEAMLSRAFGPESRADGAVVRPFQRTSGRKRTVSGENELRFERTMLAAAASGDRRMRGRRENAEGDLVTEVHQTSDGRLVVTISARAPRQTDPSQPPLVTLRWETRAHQPAVLDRSRELATPLAPAANGRLSARYELGSVEHLDSLTVHPAVWADADEVEEEAIRTAFAVTAYGNALRAWRRYVDEAPARLARVIRQLLPPGGSEPT